MGNGETWLRIVLLCPEVTAENRASIKFVATNVTIDKKLVVVPCCKFRNENGFRFNPYISDSFWSIMNECEICFRPTDSLVVKVRMTPSDYDSFFFNPNWCLKFTPNNSAPIRTKFSFRLNPLNSVKSFRMIPRHSLFSPNDSAPLRALSPNDSVAHSNGLDSEWFGNRFHIHTESHGTTFIPNESETCIRVELLNA